MNENKNFDLDSIIDELSSRLEDMIEDTLIDQVGSAVTCAVQDAMSEALGGRIRHADGRCWWVGYEYFIHECSINP